ncbi:MAG: MBL fold metallo-hydrolase [Bacilli bacterium]|jgi:phosphoribosyl 1,2-cyclic phosphodiesterase
MHYINLASGSGGNCTVICGKHCKILVDFGISLKEFKDRIKPYNIKLSDIDALFYTHSHCDHYRPMKSFSNHKIFTTTSVINVDTVNNIELDTSFSFKGLTITPISLSHDSPNTFGLIFEEDDEKLVYITDTGYISNTNIEKCKNASIYIIEANHDPIMLLNTERPYSLIVRILGDTGHLSNEDSANYLAEMIGPKTREVALAHISREANTPELALQTFKDVLNRRNIDFSQIEFKTLDQFEPTSGGNIN